MAARLAEALGFARKRGDKRLAAESLGGLAAVAALEEEHARAARLWGAAHGLRQALGAPASPVEQTLLDARRPAVRAALGDERFDAEWEEGRRLDFEAALGYAVRGR